MFKPMDKQTHLRPMQNMSSSPAGNSFKIRHGKSYKKLITIPLMKRRIILCDTHTHSRVLVHQALRLMINERLIRP